MGDDNSGQGSVKTGNVTNSTITTNIYHDTPAEDAPQSSLFLLPPNPAHFVGRKEEEDTLVAALESGEGTQAIHGLRGMGGIGKTVLAGRIARRLAQKFPDARFTIDLRGVSDNPMTAQDVMRDVLLRFETNQRLPDDEAALARQYHALLASKRVLLIIDNARDATQVADLMPQPPSAAILTSRAALDLPGVKITQLDTLPRAEAITLLRQLVPQDITNEEYDALAKCCCDHPLALTVAGTALNTHWHDYESTADYITEIEQDRENLRLEGQENYDLMACLSRSLTLLTKDDPALVEQWRDLTAFVGDFGADGAAAVLKVEDPKPLLKRLRQIGFLEAGEDRGTYTFHDLMRNLARHNNHTDRFHKPEYRHGAWTILQIQEAEEEYCCGHEGVFKGLAMWDTLFAEINAAQIRASMHLKNGRSDKEFAGLIAHSCVFLTSIRLHPNEQLRWWEDALVSAEQSGNRARKGAALGTLGNARLQLGDSKKAIKYYNLYIEIATELDDKVSLSGCLANIGTAWKNLGHPHKAIEFYEQCIDLAQKTSNRRTEGAVLGNIGMAWSQIGEPSKAIHFYEQRIEIALETGDIYGKSFALHNMSIELQKIGKTEQARTTALSALAIREQMKDPDTEKTRQLLAELEG